MSATDRPFRLGVKAPPADAPNPYTKRFYAALEESGVTVVPGLEYENAYLEKNADALDGIHLQWIEHYWPPRPRAALTRLRSLWGFRSYLRGARRLGIHLIVTIHNTVPHDSFDWIDQIGFRLAARYASLLICHSRHAAEEVERRDRARAPVLVMHHGNYDGDYPPARARDEACAAFDLDPARPIVSCVGAVRPYKGLELACEAVRELGPDVQLLIAGSPYDDGYADDLQKRFGATPSIRMVFRRLSEQEFADGLGIADVAALPYTQITGSGALLAAWSAGRRVVVSDLAYFRELLELAGGGRTFPTGDASALAQAIAAELETPESERCASAERASAEFSWSKCVEPIVRALRELVKAPT